MTPTHSTGKADGSKSENVRYRRTQKDVVKELYTYGPERKIAIHVDSAQATPKTNTRNLVVETAQL
jgi:hypothetical protein